MISIRQNVFETNSSSTHSMAIPHTAKSIPKYLYFDLGEYGWDTESPSPESYLWTAICYNKREDYLEYKKKLSNLCDKYRIGKDFSVPEYDDSGVLKYGYIDHGNYLVDFIDMLFENEELLEKFLFGGLVYTGNDNNEDDMMYSDREHEYINGRKNPYYDENLSKNYDWYYKGN